MEHPVLYVETRGGITENEHRGSLAVVDNKGNLMLSYGDVHSPRYFRSSSKPLQALPVFARHLDRLNGTTQEESVIFAASHLGDQCHIDTVRRILKHNGFSEGQLIMNPALGRSGETCKPAHCCSGKHTALMLLAKELCGDYTDYWRLESAAQKEVLSAIATMSNCERESIKTGIDGCGVPVFAVPLKNMALSFLRLARPQMIPDAALATAADTLGAAINAYPHMIRGNGALDTIINTDKNLIAKSGRCGVYCIGFRNEGLGLALKIDDGCDLHLPILLAAIFRKLGYGNRELLNELDELLPAAILDDTGKHAGSLLATLPV